MLETVAQCLPWICPTALHAVSPLGCVGRVRVGRVQEMETDDAGAAAAEEQRFEVELEFVQCLANPEYLHFLAQRVSSANTTRSYHLASSRLEWTWDDVLLLPDPRLHTTTTSLLRIVLVCYSVLFATVWRRVGGDQGHCNKKNLPLVDSCHLDCARLPCHSATPSSSPNARMDSTQTPLVVNYVTPSIVATCALVPSATNAMMMCRKLVGYF